MPQLGTCCLSKNYPVFVPFGAAWWAYAIRPYNRVRVWLQKHVSPKQPRTGDGGLNMGICLTMGGR